MTYVYLDSCSKPSKISYIIKPCIFTIAHMIPFSSLYKDALEHTSTYNSRLVFERKQRSPFLDSQTGVAQVSCHLWKSKLVRRAPAYPYQLYSYPARRWKKTPKKAATPTPTEPENQNESSDETPGQW